VIRILHIITDLDTGGAERAFYNLLSGGVAKRFENRVLSLRNGGTFKEKIEALGVPVDTLAIDGNRPSLSALKAFFHIVREMKPDIFQGWMYHGNLFALLGRLFNAKHGKVVWNVRQSLYDLKFEKPLTRMVIRLNGVFSSSANVIIYNSKLSRMHHEKIGFSFRRAKVIANGIDVRRFSFSGSSRKAVRAELKISEDAIVIGRVARFHPMKDHDAFLKAACDLLARGCEVYFLLAGSGVRVENEFFERGIPREWRDRFRLLGEREDIPELMNAMDIFCLSSWTEAFPNVLGEAMACGVPCVTTDVGDTREIVGETGIVVPPRDPAALAEGMEKMVKMAPEERKALGEVARRRIVERFSLARMVRRYAEVYEEVSSKKVTSK